MLVSDTLEMGGSDHCQRHKSSYEPNLQNRKSALSNRGFLAITSTKKWIGRLGGKRWRWLHRLVYFSGAAGVLHYYFFVKSDIEYPIAYATLLALLLGFRAALSLRARAGRDSQRADAAG